MLVISDTTALTNLYQIRLLLIMKHLYGEVLIPEGVYEELEAIPEQKEFIDNNNWIKVYKLSDRQIYDELIKVLDHGEAEAISLAIMMRADILVMDEIAGRKVAKEYGLKIIGLLGILILAKKRSIIPEVKPYMDRLVRDFNFRIHPSLYKKILDSVGE